jgi:flagellar hook-associated protein 1
MGSLTASLFGAASALDVFQYALGVSQNNIDNASTPGYARQQAVLQAMPFDPSTGLAGGVSPGQLVDSRDLFAERDVWQQAAAQGDASAQSEVLTAIQNALPVSANGGIPGALNTFFSDVSAWSASPNDSNIRQAIMNDAGALVQSFQTTAAGVHNVSQSTDQSIRDTVNQINQLSSQLSSLNAAVGQGGQHDAGLQAQIYSTLESLSGLVNISVLPQPDGTVNVMVSGGAALVVGKQSFALTATAAQAPAQNPVDSQAPPHAVIQAADGSDIISQITSGTLAGLLQVRNVTIPGLLGDATQAGALNQLAQTMAQRINTILGQGSVSPGVPSPGGLFLTDPDHPCSAAANLALDPAMSASQLPAIDENGVPNGIPLQLAALANPQQAADEVNGVSYTQFYGNTAASMGRQINQAQSDQDVASQLVAQARSMRQNSSGVSLNQEAINILQFQQAYQAAAKLVTTLNSLTQSVINMIP